MVLADTLSRLPNPYNNSDIPLDITVDEISSDDIDDHHHMDLINFSTAKCDQLRESTSTDTTLRGLQQIVYQGWPDKISDLPQELRPYWSYRDEIGMSNGVLFKGRQVIIPEALRQDILNQLHESHLGIEKTRRLMRDSVYWPNVNKDIEQMVKTCSTCQEHQPEQNKQPLLAHDIPASPWTKVASDLFEINGDHYLSLTDFYSKFPYLKKLHTTTSMSVAQVSSECFSILGPPLEIVSDNGPQYTGKPFQEMCKKWNIKHTTTSPRYPQSNGLVERQVRTVKGIIHKNTKTGNDLHIALQHLRCTTLDSNLPSPCEIMFNRPIRTNLPSHHMTSMLANQQDIQENLQIRREKMVQQHNENAGPELAPLHNGQRVRILNKETHTWCPGTIIDKCPEPRSYIVQTPNGNMLRRTRSHLRELTGDGTKIPQPYNVQKEPVAHDEQHVPQNVQNDTRPQSINVPEQRTPLKPTKVEETPTPTPLVQTNRYGRPIKRPLKYSDCA